MSPRKLLIIDVAALGWNVASELGGITFQKAESIFPAVTCTAQASFRTAMAAEHGMVSNGLFFPELRKVLFWEQSAALVRGERIWEKFRAKGGKVGMMFWQQSLGEALDLVLSPAPIHKHGGGMIQDCYTEPRELNAWLAKKLGRAFDLMNYWGPLASRESSEWIVKATMAVMGSSQFAPDVLFTYLPHLDYDLQRHGPGSAQAAKAVAEMRVWLGKLRAEAERLGYEWIIFGDYAIERAEGAIFPNRALREAGLFATRKIKRMSYPDFFASKAFAVADHQVAHVYARDARAMEAARIVLQNAGGMKEAGQPEPSGHGGNFHRLAYVPQHAGKWFAYPWWDERREAPDFASHVDIHNKPGYDPCELFFGWPPLSVSSDVNRVKGTHGRGGKGAEIAWASSIAFEKEPATFPEIAEAVRDWLNA